MPPLLASRSRRLAALHHDRAAERAGRRDDLFGPERLATHARQLARHQLLADSRADRLPRRRHRGPLLARLRRNERVLADVRTALEGAARRGLDVSPAGAWLLDNYFVIQEQVREIRASMPAGYYRELPKLDAPSAFAGFPRVYELAIELIAHTDGCVELQNIELLVREYQQVQPLTIGELWALPIMLRMGLLENVRRMALRTARDLVDQEAADAWVTRFRSATLESRNALARELSAFVHGPPELTPAFLTRFVQQLRSRRTDFTPLFWLEQWIAEDGMSMEEATQRSTQRLALTQLVMANSITSLRTVASLDWRAFVESASVSDAALRRDPAGIYSTMTFETRDRYRHAVERLARRAGRAEPEVAAIAIAVAAAARADAPERLRHVGYYLMDEGRANLERALSYRPSLGERLRRWVLRHPSPVYFGALALATAIAIALFLLPLPDHPGAAAIIAAACLAFLPATAAAIAFVNELVTSALPPTRLSRLDFTAGVPADRRTIVVVPLLLWSEDAAHDAVDRLETQYLANRDPGIRFALLSDVPDAGSEHMAADAAIVNAATAHLRRLNEKYGASAPPFYLFHRPRRWNEAQGVWMGWERKRGKLSEFNDYLRGGARDAFSIVEGDTEWLGRVRYVITLDADTVLPRGSAQALVGTIAHPLVSAEYDESRGHVTHGYGILQPRVSVTLESANRSRFARIYAGHPGIDPYTTAVSDVYQDLYAEGTFTGKGIYDVDVFERTTRGRFPENALLSHDLIEGIFARAALVTDIEVFDDFPTRYLTALHRQQRWIRGDWQLLPWLGSRIPGDGGVTPNPLPALSRWKIIDNMRRSLVSIATLLWLLLAWLVLPGARLAWLLAVLVSLAIPLLAPPLFAALRPPAGQSWRPYYAAVARDANTALMQFALAIVFLPHQALVAASAIGRTLFRVMVSHRHLLEWQTASRVERVTASTRTVRWHRFGIVIGGAVVVVALSLWRLIESRTGADLVTWLVALIVGVIWMVMPEVAHVLSAPLRRRELALAAADRVAALRYARLHWAYFSQFVSADTNWLAPDNHQETPLPVTALRTSPTNIGLQLLATASAYDLGFLTLDDMLARLDGAFASMDRMRRFHGHFFNWYDVTDLRVLDPPYVSTVDSGNLAGHLVALAEMCRALARQGDAAAPRLAALARRATAFVLAMDFRLLFDERRKLFSIGYDARTARLDTSFYDLLASEARLASFVAVAKGDVPAEHWFRLARSLTTASGATALVSWSGSMFEYLMPVLVMPSRPFSLLDQTHRAAVRRQIHYAHARGVPWGMSESAYNLRDRHATYQYRAFGVPDLALRRGLANDLVVAPYAAALALLVEPHEALANLATLEERGALGPYGFHDALDYTRPEPGESHAVVRIAMAHHIGMSLVALDNALHQHRGEGIWQRRFMADPMVRAAELLLDERVPRLYVVQQPQSDSPRAEAPERPSRDGPVLREFLTAHTGEPRVALLGGQGYCVLVTNAGAGYSRANGMAVTRWRADATRDDTGQWVYVKDLATGRVWSAAHQPTRVAADDYRVTFATDRALFERSDGGVDTRTEIVVVPRERAEIRRVTVTNRSRTPRDVELTSYGEIVLTDPDADRAHPAFQSLFVETEWIAERAAVVASRRPRAPNERQRWCAHVVAAGPEQVGAVTCETDRARFIGRGRTARAPRALDEDCGLAGTAGAVLDPVFALRIRLHLDGGRAATVAFTTIVGDDRETVLQHADRYREISSSERALALSWTEAQVELRDLDVTSAEAALYQDLAGALLYPHEELRALQFERAENRRGQQALWAHGISGDWPIVLGTISQEAGLSSVRQLLVAHRYWRMKGITSDLVILNDRGPSYQQELQDQLTAMLVASSEGALVDRPGGVCIRRGDLLGPADVALLRATARISVLCDGVGLGQLAPPSEPAPEAEVRESQIRRERESLIDRPEREPPLPADTHGARRAPVARHTGRVAENGDYEIRVSAANPTPAPWANIIANARAGFCVTERGGGCTWAENSFFYRLTPWSNDPVSDPCGEVLYLRDAESGACWTPTPGPFRADAATTAEAEYAVRHAPGLTTFTHTRDDIATELALGVPESDPVKIARLRITNQGTRRRRLTLTSYVEWTLGAQREHTRHQIHTRRDTATGAILAQNFFADDFASSIAFSWMSGPVESFTANREEFIGRNGDLGAPAALWRDALSGTTGAGYDPCAALRCALTLEPGETREVVTLLGATRGEDDARDIIARTGAPGAASAALAGAVQAWDARLATITVHTPDPEFDALVNRWSLYQALSCRMWGRSAFYQSSGAYGFRDQLQDSMAFVYAAPDVTRAHLVRCAGRQFLEGDVQHWWHEPTGRGVRTRFSDDLVWLPFAADHYVRVTGDDGVWEERANYLAMRELEPGEQDAYDQPAVSPESGTLYEHCVRALDHASTEGTHGLPLMGGGDWNDGMNLVGAGGQGESVWLAWFLLFTLRRFAEHADRRGDAGVASRFRERAARYAEAVEKDAWDGAWYRRAYYDDGTPLGSATNAECRIDSIAQSWSVIAGAAPADRTRSAMHAVYDQLVRDDARLIMLLTPPFDKSAENPGYIKGYLPGVRENGAQYTHGALWTVLATALAGDGDRASQLFSMLNPFTHARNDADVQRYKVEPYSVCADVYTAADHVGRGGWTWYTGSAAWTYRIAVETLLGFSKRGEHLRIEPCVPRDWREFTIEYRYGASQYVIEVRNPAGVTRGVSTVELDGRTVEDGTARLADDGAAHHITVTLGVPSAAEVDANILARE